ncbi:MAG TPA: PfkB family carbohydrate kinase [Xanthobacteraceae bacterium]|nr:PfkB family carbohydrate kinase [Xanthobacteraceae bacterium]
MSLTEPQVLCTGIAVLDAVFGVAQFPVPEAKTQASAFMIISGGCAANAAVAIARLGGRARFAGPLGGPAGAEAIGDRIVAALAGEQVDCAACPRVPGVASSMSAICIDPLGERAIVNYRDDRLAAARPSDPSALVATADAVLADNRFPEFVLPICDAARARGIPVVLDVDKPTRATDSLLRIATHLVFSAEGLRATVDTDDLDAGLGRIAAVSRSFLAVTDGAHGVFWRMPGPQEKVRRMSAFPIQPIDTLAAGDVFHGAFALALAEGREETDAMRFAAAAAAIKCTRFGGITGAPGRAEVEAFRAAQEAPHEA